MTMMTDINFVVLKINGTDISQLPDKKVVEMFLTADESLVVEMHPKPSPVPSCFASKTCINLDCKESNCDHINTKMNELRIVPDLNLKNEESEAIIDTNISIKLVVAIKSSDHPYNSEDSFHRTSRSTQTDSSYFLYDSAKEATSHFIEHEHNLLEQCLAPEIDIEEITLRKSDSNERLGLVVCYNGCANYVNGSENNGALSSSDDNDVCTEVFISGIQPNSVAGRDGRLRQGDQILQINGKDIKNKEETELLIAENNNAVTLLVSRYLFTDEDDFNDPLIVDQEGDDEEDVEEEDYYVERNVTYENCLLQNDPSCEIEKALALHSERKTKTKNLQADVLELKPSITTISSTATIQLGLNTSESPKKKTTKAFPSSKNTILSDKSGRRTENLPFQPVLQQNVKKMNQTIGRKIDQPRRSTKINQLPQRLNAPVGSARFKINEQQEIIYNATEHIYETIPEDSESEPLYCSPYESVAYVTAFGSCSSSATDSFQLQQQKKNVAKWLDICSTPATSKNLSPNIILSLKEPNRSSSGCIRKHSDVSDTISRKMNNTFRSTLTTITNVSSSSNGSGNSGGGTNIDIPRSLEQDYSSSAYNTGGSNNSTIPLTSLLNQDIEIDESKVQKSQLSMDKVTYDPSKDGCDDILQFPQVLHNNIDVDIQTNLCSNTSVDDQVKFSTNCLYNYDSNMCQILHKNMCREMVSKQRNMHSSSRRELIHHQQNLCCPQFVAPNLSQYHFVSSREVKAGAQQITSVSSRVNDVVNPKTISKDEPMVWKVKRRQDGTRYIVRRPARNRYILRDRSIRVNTEETLNRDISTATEEDNISEVKAGRYWSKEERKKHIERARERKQHNQQQLTNDTIASKINEHSKILQQKRDNLNYKQRSNKHQFSDHTSNKIPHFKIATSIQQHYQLQFNSSRLQKQLMSIKETAPEANDMEQCRTSYVQQAEISSKIIKPARDGQSSPLVLVPLNQTASLTNTPSFQASVEAKDIQNCVSITTI